MKENNKKRIITFGELEYYGKLKKSKWLTKEDLMKELEKWKWFPLEVMQVLMKEQNEKFMKWYLGLELSDLEKENNIKEWEEVMNS